MNLPFFTIDEIEHFHLWVDTAYDKNNLTHVTEKNFIRDNVWTKTKYWSEQLMERLSSFSVKNRRMWGQRGWIDTDGGKQAVSKFKHYTWARLFEQEHEDKDIYFTVGIDGRSKEIIYKLDFQREGKTELTANQKRLIDENIPTNLRWVAISLEDLSNYNWDKLIQESFDFIINNLDVYHRIIRVAWNGENELTVFRNYLNLRDKPTKTYTKIPKRHLSFSGISKDTDYIRKAISDKAIGNAGELLVVNYEADRLRNIGLSELAEKVKLVEKDGLGYDVLSFKRDGTPKHIEVKTTRNAAHFPFKLTLNEKLFMEQNLDNYYIYRLYQYEPNTNRADFYIIERPLEELLFEAVEFNVFPKKNMSIHQ